MRILFLTGNSHKLAEARAILAEHDVEGRELDLPEIQSLDPKGIIAAKLEAARGLIGGENEGREHEKSAALLVEDVSFWIGETGFPGPLFKFMYKALGREGVVQFARAFGATTATAVCEVGLLLPGKDAPEFFTGSVSGSIVDPRGDSGFGFDPIFIPDGQEKTFAEMSAEEKNALSHRRRAVELVEERLRKGPR